MSTTPNIKLPTAEEIQNDPELAGMVFGDTGSALDEQVFWDDFHAGFMSNEDYYRPPLPFEKLAKTLRVNAYHGAMPSLKANRVVRYMIPNQMISRATVVNAVMDHQTLGNCSLKLTRTRRGGAVGIEHYPMMKVRRMKDRDQFGWMEDGKINKFKRGEIVHVYEYDPAQKIYGVPFWVPALQSILLGENVRIFPRMFFDNGLHAKMMIATAGLGVKARTAFNDALKKTKGKGSLKSLVQHFNGRDIEKMIKVFDFAENAYKIDYSGLATMTNKDIMAAWRTPPELAGQLPENPGGSGDLDKKREMYHENEIVPLQEALMEAINPHVPPKYRLQFRDFGDTKSPE